ncbi:MAG: hypothetical protein K8R40_09375 [Anaerolineaceae bacterium]|nr:hypothetical protein [Anaerolineaceae bacterium]
MSISELRTEASRTIGITKNAIKYRVKKIKEKYGPFSEEVAYGIVAHMGGVDVSTIVADPQVQKQIRDQLDRINEIELDTPKPKTKTVVKTVVVNIGKDLQLNDPVLDDKVLSEAKEMTVVYAELYVFENSVREVINRVLTKNHGIGWWNTGLVNNDLLTKVENRIDKENKNPWHGRRGAHPICYTDILDLNYLFRRHWLEFKDIFPRKEWVSEKLEQVAISRNVVDHHNPLRVRDCQRLKMNLKDWQEQITAKKGNI